MKQYCVEDNASPDEWIKNYGYIFKRNPDLWLRGDPHERAIRTALHLPQRAEKVTRKMSPIGDAARAA